MRKPFLFVFFGLFVVCFNMYAQKTDTSFQKQWLDIDSLIVQKDLPKTALAKVNKIYKEAMQRKLSAQSIKALLYKMSLQQNADKGINDQVAELKEEIKKAFTVTHKSILQTLLAQTYLNYYNINRWKLYSRKQATTFNASDIETWSANDFHAAIAAAYFEALKPAPALQQTTLQPYAAVIIKGNTPKLRPTLYDLVAHQALDYFKSDDAYLTKPAYMFQISDEAALGTVSMFANHSFESKDSLSHQLLALNLSQQLIKFHMHDKEPDALIDVNLERITWVESNAILDNKAALYLTALKEITQQYTDEPAAAQAWYLLAKLHADKASTYQPLTDTANRFEYVAAKQIIEQRLKQQPAKSEGNSNMQSLLAQIEDKQVTAQVENVNIPSTPFRLFVNYKNVDTLYVRIIRKEEFKKITNGMDSAWWQAISKTKFVASSIQPLPTTGDHQLHGVEIKIDALPVGKYILLTSSSKSFSNSKDRLTMQYFDVSGISYIKTGYDYFVLNRETGQPIENAGVKYSITSYNSKQRKNVTKKGLLKVLKNGFFSLKDVTDDNNGNINLSFYNGNDSLIIDNNEYFYRPYSNDDDEDNSDDEAEDYEKNKAKVYFFTDRSIYRPGQTVYFKGIAVTKNYKNKQPTLYQSKDSITIKLNDANSQEIDSLKLFQNEYGSITGKFKLPENVLTGEFSIEANDLEGRVDFSVEEYKRPKFYVAFDTLKGSYRLNDSIHITGYAKAYAGNDIDGATVHYNISRGARFPYPWLIWKRPASSSSQQIKNGTLITDAKGKFEIVFKATPDSSVDKKTEPVFEFEIEASVTDINGETREKKTSVAVSYKSLLLQLNVPGVADVASFKNISVATKNSANEDVPANVHINVIPLQPSTDAYRKRYWEQSDVFVMTEKEYHEYFPYDEYAGESDYHNWPKQQAIITDTFSTATTTNYKLPTTNLKQGWYLIEASTIDKDGNEVKDIKYVQLYDANARALPSPQNNFQQVVDNTAAPGEQAKIITGTSLNDVFVIQQTSRPKSKSGQVYDFFTLTESKKEININVTEEDRGGLSVYYAFVKHNRFYTNGMSVDVPYDNKDLQVSYTSFRDKTEPGSKEQWSIKVSGNKAQKVTAELLTTMYDASLDQFKMHNWSKPDVWITNYLSNAWQQGYDFSFTSSVPNYYDLDYSYYYKTYHQLVTDANQFQQYNYPGFPSDNLIRRRFHTGVDTVGVVDINSGEVMSTVLRAPLQLQAKVSGLQIAPAPHMKVPTPSSGGRANEINKEQQPQIELRKNFNETAFFFPQLHADSSGNYSFSFTMPEALTQWKWLSFAHTKDLSFGVHQATITTQKTLMLQPNLPRFLREGDKIELSVKIANLSDSELTGHASLQLVDAITNQPVDGLLQNIFPDQYFTAPANGSASLKFPVSVPYNFTKPLAIRLIAKAGNYSDGEENIIPVLTNRMLVTETLPLFVKGDTTQHFSFTKLINNKSETLHTESLTVEYTANPIWNAVQALPYLIEYPYECAEQTFNRFYANALAAFIVKQHPRIQQAFDVWAKDSTSLQSNLEKNTELKQVLLQETPWVLDAKNEAQQRKNIALLFDIVKMSAGAKSALLKLQEMQNATGGFSWFKGGNEDRYITQYILTGIGKLNRLNAIPADCKTILDDISTQGIQYADKAAKEEYDDLIKHKADLSKNQLSASFIQYAYMKSFYTQKTTSISPTLLKFYTIQTERFWIQQNNLYLRGMMTLALHRLSSGKSKTPLAIIHSLKENAIETKEGSMYWKNNINGYYWQQSAIETQALLINAFDEIAADKNTVSKMQTWLLLNKQTNNWKTTKATADACYALLFNNSLSQENKATIQLGSITFTTSQQNAGYLKQRIEGDKVSNDMGNVTVTTSAQSSTQNSPSLSYGAVYWQYFEDLDKITSSSSPLSLTKSLFIEKNTDNSKQLSPVAENQELYVGDKLTVRIVLKSDRDMEYIHLKDMRASSTEPVNVLSGYKWQDGLGYYEATKDASTNFFIANLRKGTYVFDYPLYITHTGTFSVGIATVQCMYAPEFSSHSEGIKISVTDAKQ